MTPSPLIVAIEDRPRALDIAGFAITVLASSEQTGGYEIFHMSGPEGTGPGPHFHPWDESFFILSGSLACGVGDTETLALPGTLVHVPGGSVHWFKFGQDGGVMMSMTSLGNASKMFTDFDREGSWDNPDRAKLIALVARHGQVVVPTTD